MHSILNVKKKVSTLSNSKVNSFLQFRKKAKLKKKWRFWRSFKFYFLRKKSLSHFLKLKWFFNQNRIMWHYFVGLYGKKIKSLVFNKIGTKFAFGKPFMSMISFFELRLNVLILRMRFAYKQLEANLLILKGLILVNGIKKSKNYLVCINDIIKKIPMYFHEHKRFFKKKKWRRYKWKRFLKKQKRVLFLKGIKTTNVFWISKTMLSVNYLEINYRINAGVVLKTPTFGEILISSSKKLLSSTMLKKIYFLF